MSFTIGSLFDGSGGFPLAAFLSKGVPVWASEIEPYPIAVTTSRFLHMKHLGSVTDINGAEVDPVDVITFGSPCQDLSVAGKRAGLKHEANGDEETTRSGLFMEAVRIIKEMREKTNGVYPRIAVWENVPGAFSSNKGEDFRIVCEELIKIVEPSAFMPPVPKNGWAYSDCYVGDGWSLAYRVLDAQHWGVPQRRRRIYLVADFRGTRAGKILFERDGLRGYFETGRTPWQTTPVDAQRGSGANDRERSCIGFDGYNSDLTGDVAATLGVNCGMSTGRNGVAVATELPPTTIYAVDQGGGKSGANVLEGMAPTLCTTHGGEPAVAYSFDSLASNSMKSSNPHSGCRAVEVAKTLDTTDPNPSKNQGGIAIVQQIPYTLKIRSGCEGGGKGALVQEDLSATLATNNDQYLFQPVPEQYLFENHSQDTRYTGPLDVAPIVSATFRMGGNNQPFVVEPFCKSARAQSADDATTWKHGKVANTLNTFDMGETRANELVVEGVIPIHDQATRFSGKRGDKSDGKGNGLGVGEPGDPMNTLTGGDRHAVAYLASGKEATGTLMASMATKQCLGDQEAFSGDYHIVEECARDYKGVGSQYVSEDKLVIAPKQRYIVRRLTPTECARLQGFPDKWGHPDRKDDLTDEEYRFWLEVRNTHAAINGKATRDYTKQQMLTWYNKLHTDSSEYKMWGNGIALPCALYVMQGIAEVFE